MLGESKPEDVLPLADFFGLEDLQNVLNKYILKVMFLTLYLGS